MTDPNPLREDGPLPPGFRPLGEFLDELEADMAADAEREVEAVARVIYCAIEGISQEHNQAHLDYWFVSPDSLDANGVDEYRAAARAAITALDQVREGRAK